MQPEPGFQLPAALKGSIINCSGNGNVPNKPEESIWMGGGGAVENGDLEPYKNISQ